jgi:hypothetical protein
MPSPLLAISTANPTKFVNNIGYHTKQKTKKLKLQAKLKLKFKKLWGYKTKGMDMI